MNINDINSLKQRAKSRPNTSGVYFLLKDKEVVYVGKTIEFNGRIKLHLANPILDFNYYYLHPLPVFYDMNIIEEKYIRELKPKYNCLHNPDYEEGKNRIWFTFIKQFKSYEELSGISGISVNWIKRYFADLNSLNMNNRNKLEYTILAREKVIPNPALKRAELNEEKPIVVT